MLVNVLRFQAGFSVETAGEVGGSADGMKKYTSALFLDRWVGIEGVMSVIDKPELGGELFEQRVSEFLCNRLMSDTVAPNRRHHEQDAISHH